jgi:hypothetical protein
MKKCHLAFEQSIQDMCNSYDRWKTDVESIHTWQDDVASVLTWHPYTCGRLTWKKDDVEEG